ncbi:erythromycin esterase family protein [Evansella halocellulosilytica]|uniref:erythromycin esterase family protein n=1 Tax=Evansella halocellulosilytica TaxID=2011013 RepID=UPI000BB79C54|nr:erythromycin esterase family protein [Evansella halocellulosilytica]
MIKVITTLAVMVLLLSSCHSETGVFPLKNHESTKYDFSGLDQFIEDKQVIFIGESTHGAEEFTEIKAELVKYLSENHGYSILAMESGKVEINFLNDRWQFFDDQFMMKSMIYEAWNTPAMKELIQYIRENEGLTIEGLDPWPVVSGRWIGESELHQYIKERILNEDSNLAREFIDVDNKFITFMNEIVFDNYNMIDFDRANLILKEYKDFLYKGEELQFAEMEFVKGRINVLEQYFNEEFLSISEFDNPHQAYFSRRDLSMFNELENIINENPEEKVIVWAHNGHIQKNFELIDQTNEYLAEDFDPPPLVLGSLAADKLGDDAYFIGMYFNQGSIKLLDDNIYDIEPKSKDSELEYILSQYGHEKIFIDFESHNEEWSNTSVKAYSEGFFEYYLTPSEQYDALIFIDSVNPR